MSSPVGSLRTAATGLLAGLAVACSSGDAPPADASELLRRIGDLPGPRLRPSGAQVRIVNAYAPTRGVPATLAIYPGSIWSEGDTALVSVPYGSASPLFDPTVADEDGNMILHAYLAGDTAKANRVSSWTATLKGGERITYVLTSAKPAQDSGRASASLQIYEHEVTGDMPRPGPGNGLLMVQGAALYQVLGEDTQFYLSVGRGCVKSYYEEAPGSVPVQHMSGPEYLLDPGEYTVSLHPADQFPPTCTSAPVVGNIPVKVRAGERSILLFFPTGDREFGAVQVPLTP
jgi:hypothetical protein